MPPACSFIIMNFYAMTSPPQYKTYLIYRSDRRLKSKPENIIDEAAIDSIP
jgi:hypothetical protein